MEEEKENSSLSQAQQYPTSYLQDQDLISISKIFAGCDPSAFELCANEIIDPDSLDFIPKGNWTSKPTSLDSLRVTYFGRKNNVNRRFEHKLWNALRITAVHPNLIRFIGVCWVNNYIIKVYKKIFAKLLNIKDVDAGLFHKQGNFTRHGFVICTEAKAVAEVPEDQLADVDYRDVVLIYHKDNIFKQNSSEDTICNCKWSSPKTENRIASIKMDKMPSIESVE